MFSRLTCASVFILLHKSITYEFDFVNLANSRRKIINFVNLVAHRAITGDELTQILLRDAAANVVASTKLSHEIRMNIALDFISRTVCGAAIILLVSGVLGTVTTT